MGDESANPGGPTAGATSAPCLPAAVDRAAFQAELDRLRVREKAHTREGDAKDIRRAIFQTLSGSDPYEVGARCPGSVYPGKPGHVQWSRSERRSEVREIRWSLAM